MALAELILFYFFLNFINGHDEKNFEFIINIFAWQRYQSLERLLISLNNAKYPKNTNIDIFFHLEYNFTKNVFDLTKNFSWKIGKKKIIQYNEKRGLKLMIPFSWNPIKNNEYAFFFEDDIEVHKHYFLYTKKVLEKFSSVKYISGISLNTPRFDEVNVEHSIWPPPDMKFNSNIFFLQQPSSWGALFFPEHWKKFVEYFKFKYSTKNADVVIPNSPINNWHSSWKKYYMEYMFINLVLFIFPIFKNEACFSIHHSETGVHHSKSLSYDFYKNEFVPYLKSKTFLKSNLTEDPLAFNFYFIKINGQNILDELRIQRTRLFQRTHS